MRTGRATVGVFDAGIGGIPLAARLAKAGHRIVYLGDAARRPYGPQSGRHVARYVAEAEAFFTNVGCDVWVIACNTASVVAADALVGTIPCVDMVTAVRHEFPVSGSGPLGLIATAGTVSSGAFVDALPTYDLHQVATEELLRLAEEGGGDRAQIRAFAARAFEELRAFGCSDVVLACTDYTCVFDELTLEAGDLRLADPLAAAANLVELHLSDQEASPEVTTGDHRLVLTGPHPVDVSAYARERFELDLPEPEYRPLTAIPATR